MHLERLLRAVRCEEFQDVEAGRDGGEIERAALGRHRAVRSDDARVEIDERIIHCRGRWGLEELQVARIFLVADGGDGDLAGEDGDGVAGAAGKGDLRLVRLTCAATVPRRYRNIVSTTAIRAINRVGIGREHIAADIPFRVCDARIRCSGRQGVEVRAVVGNAGDDGGAGPEVLTCNEIRTDRHGNKRTTVPVFTDIQRTT